ncbi:UNVERIFIED_CONTAM: hypothetical protein Slati_2400900 [Sesamum latifolium]|uniref:Reverse transcriptase/retrotransposon-derived protein RNase H-like domain-containing protein n=1 Tax=Sesamum latifolium TaxID=2727402 RepID=A0AAW2WBS1_9LAMI
MCVWSTGRSFPWVHDHTERHRGYPLKIKVIFDMKAPTNVNEVQRLTGRIAALSRYISKAVEKSLPFFKVLRKAKTFEWDAPCQQAFEELKSYLAELPLLVKPSPGVTGGLFCLTAECIFRPYGVSGFTQPSTRLRTSQSILTVRRVSSTLGLASATSERIPARHRVPVRSPIRNAHVRPRLSARIVLPSLSGRPRLASLPLCVSATISERANASFDGKVHPRPTSDHVHCLLGASSAHAFFIAVLRASPE